MVGFCYLWFVYHIVIFYHGDGDIMKVRIKSGECPSYLTVGKVYEAHEDYKDLMACKIYGDNGRELTINLDYSPHLNGGSWEIVDECF